MTKEYKVFYLSNIYECKTLENYLNNGWKIIRVDSDRDRFIYILEKEN